MSFTYQGLRAAKKTHIVTPEEVREQMEHLLKSRPRITEIRDRNTKNGDEVLLDYAGFCGGDQFPGGTAQGQTLVLGSGTFIPGFEEQLVDCTPGQEVTVHVTFPKEYHAPELAGKEAQFRCTLHAILEKSPYEMDETFAREVGQCDTVAEMEEKMGRSMQFYQDEKAETELQDSLLRQAAATLDAQFTDAQIRQAVDRQMEAAEAQLRQQGLSLDLYCQFMKTTPEKLRRDAEPAARDSLLTEAAIRQIAALEDLRAEPQELQEAREHIARSNGIPLEQLNAMEDPELDAMVERAVITGKAMGLIRDSAIITEE